MTVTELRKPQRISRYAQACLHALASRELGTKLSIGGALALAFYFEYRETHDIDAWWEASAGAEDRRNVVSCVEETLQRFGEVRIRSWGDVVSVELLRKGKTAFSFQIASRSAQLESPRLAPWPAPLLVDSFPDLVAAKTVALVERGAPRDFRDIHALCKSGLVDAAVCWRRWKERQQRAGEDTSSSRARLALLTHLGRIELHRPLTEIKDVNERNQAEGLRAWFRKEFLDALVD